MEAQVKGVSLKWDSEGSAELCLPVVCTNLARLKQQVTEAKQSLEKGKVLDLELKEHREKRSQNANAYMWKLLDEMAKRLCTSKDNLYDQMLIQYGVFDTMSVKSEAVEQYIKLCGHPTKVLGKSKLNGQEFAHIRVCYGSSGYDKAQMKRLLDGIVSECADLEIETQTPTELSEMMSLWEVNK